MQISHRICNGIFNHTSLFEFYQGKLLLHLTMPFEEKPKTNLPSDNLKYYRFLSVPYTEALKSVRTALGLSQKAFAERIGLVPSYYYKIEEGNRRPSRKVYQKIYAALETTSLQTSLLGEHTLQ